MRESGSSSLQHPRGDEVAGPVNQGHSWRSERAVKQADRRVVAAVLGAVLAATCIGGMVLNQPSYEAMAADGTQTLTPWHVYLGAVARNYSPPWQPAPPDEVWRPFTDDSPWNTPLGDNPPVHPMSDAFIARAIQTYRERDGNGELSVGTAGAVLKKWSVPVYFVEDLDPYPPEVFVDAHTRWGHDLWAPIPEFAQPDPSADAHLCVIDRNTNEEWDFWQLRGKYPSFTSGTGRPYDTGQSGARAAGEPGCRESGFPLIAGLIRPEEMEAGEIRHALVFAFDARDGAEQFVYPASTGCDYNNSAAEHVWPIGTRIQLKPGVDISYLPRGAEIVAQALKEYGAYLGDENDSMSIGVAFQQNRDWSGLFDPKDKDALTSLTVSDFRVIEPPEPAD